MEVFILINTLKIKARIVECGLKQKDIAKALNLSPSTVSQKLNNIRPMNLKEADSLAELLGISTMEIGEYFFSSKIA